MLDIESLSKSFGGVHAVDSVSFTVKQGAIHSLIGPNGAGKTTLFNLITGLYVPTSGDIRLNGSSIAGFAPERLATLGISRTFQNLQICMNMHAVENVMIGAHLRLNTSFLAAMIGFPSLLRSDSRNRAEAEGLMSYCGLSKHVSAHAREMPYGALKRLEVARALASQPKLLLLDEPAAGLNEVERVEIAALIRRIAQSGVTVILVEHDMKLVMSLSDHIIVLDYGRKLAEGTADQVRNDPSVIEAYLGAA